MSRTEDRLSDALTAAAHAIPEDTLRPLIAPPPRRRAAWVAPLAAALGIVLVVGLAIALGTRLGGSGSSGPTGGPAPVPRFYVVDGIQGGAPVVRSTATGKVTGTVPVSKPANLGVEDLVASTRSGEYFIVAAAPGIQGQRLYRFRLTSAGRVTGFAAVRDGTFGARSRAADAIAASPDGSRVAISLAFNSSSLVCPAGRTCQVPVYPDYIDVIDVRTGARSVWRDGTGSAFSVASLSWTAHGRRLVYLGQTCGRIQLNSEVCGHGRSAEVRALNPAADGGRLDSGRVLLRQSARYPYVVQAEISPDGSTITAIVLTGRVKSTRAIRGMVPSKLTVIQVSATTGQPRQVLYQRNLGAVTEINNGPDFLQLSQDAAGQHWMLNGGLCAGNCADGFNGWLRDGRLVPLVPLNGREVNQAW